MRRSRGFTLVEMLVVIAIVTVAAALTIGVLAAVKGSSKEAGCLEHLRQLGAATFLYAADHDDRLTPVDANREAHEDVLYWRDTLLPYTKSTDVFFCPADAYARKRYWNVWYWESWTLWTSYWRSMGQGTVSQGKVSYLDLGRLADAARATHLRDQLREVQDDRARYGRRTYTVHGKRSNVLYLDGHVKGEPDPWVVMSEKGMK